MSRLRKRNILGLVKVYIRSLVALYSRVYLLPIINPFIFPLSLDDSLSKHFKYPASLRQFSLCWEQRSVLSVLRRWRYEKPLYKLHLLLLEESALSVITTPPFLFLSPTGSKNRWWFVLPLPASFFEICKHKDGTRKKAIMRQHVPISLYNTYSHSLFFETKDYLVESLMLFLNTRTTNTVVVSKRTS